MEERKEEGGRRISGCCRKTQKERQTEEEEETAKTQNLDLEKGVTCCKGTSINIKTSIEFDSNQAHK